MAADTYRTRIYKHYVQARAQNMGPDVRTGLKPRAPYLRRMVREHFPPNRQSQVLDIGCGHGALLSVVREMGYKNLRGVDGSLQQVAAAHALGIPEVEFGDLLAALAAQPDSSLNVVVAFDVIEHFTRDELLLLVDAVHRVLMPDGRWILHVPNGESPFFGAVRYGDLTHELAFTRTSLYQLLLSSGFSEVRCFEDVPVVHGAKSALRWVLWMGFRSLLRMYVTAETGDGSSDHIFSRNLLAVARK